MLKEFHFVKEGGKLIGLHFTNGDEIYQEV